MFSLFRQANGRICAKSGANPGTFDAGRYFAAGLAAEFSSSRIFAMFAAMRAVSLRLPERLRRFALVV
jgi:hypothetical protein